MLSVDIYKVKFSVEKNKSQPGVLLEGNTTVVFQAQMCAMENAECTFQHWHPHPAAGLDYTIGKHYDSKDLSTLLE